MVYSSNILNKALLTLCIFALFPILGAFVEPSNKRYKLIIFDEANDALLTKQNLLAKNATNTETLYFPGKEIYHMVLAVTGLLKPGQMGYFTRNEVATGFLNFQVFSALH